MELLLVFLPGLILASVLYLLNKIFSFKDKLISYFGVIKYKVGLMALTIILYFVLVNTYGLNSRSSIINAIFLCYIYMMAVRPAEKN